MPLCTLGWKCTTQSGDAVTEYFFFIVFCFVLLYFLFKFFYYIIFYFTVLYWFCHTSTCIRRGCTCVPNPEPPPSSIHIPSLWVIPVHQPQASCILHWTWTGDSFLIWYYTCFNAILPHHPPLPLPQSPKDCYIHLCLFRCLTYRVVITIFLNSIYICISILYWCFSFWLTSLCIIGSSFIHLIRTDSNVFFLMAE